MPSRSLAGGEDIPIIHLEQRLGQHFRSAEQLHAHVVDFVEAEEMAFFDGKRDIGAFAGLGVGEKRWLRLPPGVSTQLHGLIENLDREIPFLLVSIADALFVFFQLAGVIGFIEEIFKPDGIRDTDGLQVLHRANDLLRAEDFVAQDIDFADLDLGAFIDIEDHFQRTGRNAAHDRVHYGELAAALCQQFFE